MVVATIELYRQGETTPSGVGGVFLDVAPITVLFKVAVSSGTPTAFHWDFGDGVFSDTREVLHTYSSYGSHRVVLTTTDVDGGYVSPFFTVVLGKLYFSADVVRGLPPLSVYLTDQSIAPAGYGFTGMIWSYGDGLTGMVSSHTYTEVKKYSVSLSAVIST